MTRALTPEQLLTVADEFCRVAPATVRSFAALVAAAAVPGARVGGVPVFDSTAAAAECLESTIVALTPLSGHNREFAGVARRVYLDWADSV